MRIVNRTEFLKLPANTLFSKYAPCYMEALEIKGDTIVANDFGVQQIADAIRSDSGNDFANKLQDAEETGKSLTMDFDYQGRDGCFDADQLFAVWEPEDVFKLMQRLYLCVAPGAGEAETLDAFRRMTAAAEVASLPFPAYRRVEPPTDFRPYGNPDDGSW
jgi:hypothetical protein